jgi:plasmid stabilization system protein ParE
MTGELIIRPEAEADIAQAFGWYEAQVPALGSQFLLILDAAFNSILGNHLTYPQVYKTVRRALIRRFPPLIVSGRDQGFFYRPVGTKIKKL